MPSKWIDPLVRELIDKYGGIAPETIFEKLAQDYLVKGSQNSLPVDVEGIASLLGIRRRYGDYAFAGRIYAEADGQLVMDLNRSDSDTRRRFTCGHEIMHTVFPGFQQQSRYRADPVVETYNRARGEEEYLCDVGAAALIMPRSLIQTDYSLEGGLEAVERLACDAEVSLEAAGNRLVSLSVEPGIFLVLQLSNKPADLPRIRKGESVEPRLRIQYAVVQGMNLYLPKYKSVDDGSVFTRALDSMYVEQQSAPLPGSSSDMPFNIEAKAYPRTGPGGEIKRVLAVAHPSVNSSRDDR